MQKVKYNARIQEQEIIGRADGSNSKRIYNCLLYPIKTENPILSFLIWNFLILIFPKKNNLIMNLMTYIAMFDWFLILFARERFPWKKAKAGKNVILWKNFFL